MREWAVMELGLLVGMLIAGALLAATAAWRFYRSEQAEPHVPLGRERIEQSLLNAIGDAGADRKSGGAGIDICSWAEAFAGRATPAERRQLLEKAVTVAAGMHRTIPLGQYNALLELGFGLGLHSDAFAVLRERLRFDYVDWARAGRPRAADRAAAVSLFQAERPGEREKLLRKLGLEGDPSRVEITAAWRRVAAASHPDRFHAAGEREQQRAAAQFIEATEAYERLLFLVGECESRR